MKKRSSIFVYITAAVFVLLTVFNGIAWLSADMIDFYHEMLYSPAATLISHISGIFPFSLGEILIALAVLICLFTIVALIVGIIGKKKGLLTFTSRLIVIVLLYIYFTETMNCFVLYHSTELKYRLSDMEKQDGYSTEELVAMCGDIIKHANELALKVSRDENGQVIVPDDLGGLASDAFSDITDQFPELNGYCPPPKIMIASTLMTQLDLQGVYFPFSLEGNYNAYLSPARVPCTAFHELTHIKGFIREDEATFLSCIACMVSDSPEVQYSGYITAMNYTFGECRKYANEEQIYSLCSKLTMQVALDNYFVSEEHMKKAEESVIPKETVNKAGETAMETTLKVNGVKDGKNSYNRMVELLLIWYYGRNE